MSNVKAATALALAVGSLTAMSAQALSPANKLIDVSFDSASSWTQYDGTCTVSGSTCSGVELVGSTSDKAIAFKQTGAPKLEFPVTRTGGTNIAPDHGTIVFDYTPLATPDGDWGGTSTPAQKLFFRLYDSNSAYASYETLGIGTYFESNKNYLYFRYDTTDGCLLQWDGVEPCKHTIGSMTEEPYVVMAWNPGVAHRIEATWDYRSTATHKFLALSIDGQQSWYREISTPVSLASFSPSKFFVGSYNGNYPAQGTIDNLQIYSEVAFDPADPVASYKADKLGDGVWQTHETVADSDNAPTLTISQPFIFYRSYAFEPIFEGTVPASATEPTDIPVDLAKGQRETSFFNIYAGTTAFGTVTAAVSDLTNGSETLDQSHIKVRTVHNWWQAGNAVYRNLFVPAYTPELLLYDDKDGVPHCTGTSAANPCASALPSDPYTAYTTTQVAAQTSRQFALTLDIPDDAVAGTYTGTITVAATSTSGTTTRTLPIHVVVHDFTLPPIDKTIALYGGSSPFADTTDNSYVSEGVFELQMQNMQQHGVNGMLFGGQAWSLAQANIYPSYSVAAGLARFGAYPFNVDGYPISSPYLDKVSYLIAGLKQNDFEPYIYGEDEPNEVNGSMARHLAKSKAIHASCPTVGTQSVCGKVVVAINKGTADLLNDSTLASYDGYSYAERQVDLPNLTANDTDAATVAYFDALLSGDHSGKAPYDELYYWQMYMEDPRINRFYTGYHLWLTDLAGVMPYVHQRLLGDPFDDFSGADLERDLVTVYPSQQGGIDTIEWEAFAAGVNDYRLLQLWKQLHDRLATRSSSSAADRATTLDDLLGKYRDRRAYDDVSREQFAADRAALLGELDAMAAEIHAGDQDDDGVDDEIDNCPSIANPEQGDADNDGIGDYCDDEPGC